MSKLSLHCMIAMLYHLPCLLLPKKSFMVQVEDTRQPLLSASDSLQWPQQHGYLFDRLWRNHQRLIHVTGVLSGEFTPAQKASTAESVSISLVIMKVHVPWYDSIVSSVLSTLASEITHASCERCSPNYRCLLHDHTLATIKKYINDNYLAGIANFIPFIFLSLLLETRYW